MHQWLQKLLFFFDTQPQKQRQMFYQKQLALSKSQIRKIEKIRVRGLEFVAQANRSFEEGVMNHDKRLEVLRDYRIEQGAQMKKVLSPTQAQTFFKLCGKPVQGI